MPVTVNELVLVLLVFRKSATDFLAGQEVDPHASDSLSASLGHFVGSLGTRQEFEDTHVGNLNDVSMSHLLGEQLLNGFQYAQGLIDRDVVLVSHQVKELLLLNVAAMIHAGIIAQLAAAISGLNDTFFYFQLRFHLFCDCDSESDGLLLSG